MTAFSPLQHDGVIMGRKASQITSLPIVYSTVYSGADQRKHQSSASLAFVRGPVNSPHKWPATRKMFSFDDVIMTKNLLKLGHGWVNDISPFCDDVYSCPAPKDGLAKEPLKLAPLCCMLVEFSAKRTEVTFIWKCNVVWCKMITSVKY